jgi:hypothetical protein
MPCVAVIPAHAGIQESGGERAAVSGAPDGAPALAIRTPWEVLKIPLFAVIPSTE